MIEVRADRTRALPIVDPSGRELTISCGAAVELARVAVRGLGGECIVHLLPETDDSDLLARLAIGKRRAATDDERDLMEAIARRYTDRGSYPRALGQLGSPTRSRIFQRGTSPEETFICGRGVPVRPGRRAGSTSHDRNLRRHWAQLARRRPGNDRAPAQ